MNVKYTINEIFMISHTYDKYSVSIIFLLVQLAYPFKCFLPNMQYSQALKRWICKCQSNVGQNVWNFQSKTTPSLIMDSHGGWSWKVQFPCSTNFTNFPQQLCFYHQYHLHQYFSDICTCSQLSPLWPQGNVLWLFVYNKLSCLMPSLKPNTPMTCSS